MKQIFGSSTCGPHRIHGFRGLSYKKGHISVTRHPHMQGYFHDIMRAGIEAEKKGCKIVVPELDLNRQWHISRAARRAARDGAEAVQTGYNKGIGNLSEDEVRFAQGYSYIWKKELGMYVETPKTMLSYLATEIDPKKLYTSYLAVLLNGEGKMEGTISGATIKATAQKNLLFVGYNIPKEDLSWNRSDIYNSECYHVLMNGAMENSTITYGKDSPRICGKEPYYVVVEAGGEKEINLFQARDGVALRGIDYRQCELAVDYSKPKTVSWQRAINTIFEKCEPLTLMLRINNGEGEMGVREVKRIVKTLYRYYGLTGDKLKEFMNETFKGVSETAKWVLDTADKAYKLQ